MEPLTSTSSTTRRGRVPRRRQAISAGLAEVAQRVAQGARRVELAAVPAAVPGRTTHRRVQRQPHEHRRAAGASPPRRGWRRRGAGGPPPPTPSRGPRPPSSVSPAPPAPSASGSRCAVAARDASRCWARGSPSRGVEPRREDLVVAGEVVGRPAERGPAGPVGRLPVVGADGRHRRQEAVGPVLGDRHAGGPERAGEAEEHLVGVVEGVLLIVAHRESIRSSAARTRSASSRYFSRAPRVMAADARSRSAVPR